MNTTIKYGIFILVLVIVFGFSGFFLWSTMTVNQIMQGFLINAFSGIVVSFTFILLLLRFFRPKFEISPFICHKEGSYFFKVVNKSIYHAFDIKFEVSIMIPYTHINALPSVEIHGVPLTTASLTTINRYRKKRHEKDPFSLFAISVFTKYNIEEKLKDQGAYIEFRLTARHGLTGLAHTFVKKYSDESVIKANHKFCYGAELETVPLNKS